MDNPSPLREWSRDVLLQDGSIARIRPLDASDGVAWRTFYSGLSERTLYSRFMGHHPTPSDAEMEYFIAVDHSDRMAFVAEQHGAFIGIGRYDRIGVASAEVAFVVADAEQGHGVGTLLLEFLTAFAASKGITRLVADTLADNRRMVDVFRAAGFTLTSNTSSGVTRITLDVALTAAAVARVNQLKWEADQSSLRHILEPRGIAVIGASSTGAGIGSVILANLREGGYAGHLVAINSKVDEPSVTDGVSWFRRIQDSQLPLDLAVVAVPAANVPAVVDACGEVGVRGMVIVSSGFAESGVAGRRLQEEVMERAHRAGIRVVGPNCLGVVNTAAGVSMNATFAAGGLQSGRVALASQSGAVGIALLARTSQLDLGVSSFVSMGNKADVSGNDLLRFWHSDPTTGVILLYLESLGNPREFFDIARVVGRTKPIIVVKSGRSPVGARAAASHTASIASSDRAADTLFAQAGVIRASTLEEMLQLGSLIEHAPIPRGRRIAIVTNVGGAGVLAADTAADGSLRVETLPTEVQSHLRAAVPAAASTENPVDLGAGADLAAFKAALGIVAQCPAIDAVVAIHAAVAHLDTEAFVVMASEVAEEVAIPVVAVTLGEDSRDHAAVARFAFPEAAVRSLARLVAYGEWRERGTDAPVILPNADALGARELVRTLLLESPDGRWLTPSETGRLLEYYGVPQEVMRTVRTTTAAIAAAREIGWPVAVKAIVRGLVHKTDAGAVVLNVRSALQLQVVMREFRRLFEDRLHGVMVQRMTPAGVELIVGAVRDRTFGSLIAYGSGGTNAELLADQHLRLAPLTHRESTELAVAPRGARLLEGFRGQPRCDIPAVADVLRRIAQLAVDVPEIAEMECNPLVATPAGVVAVDSRARIAPITARAPSWLRTIRSGHASESLHQAGDLSQSR